MTTYGAPASLADAWAEAVTAAREFLAAVERGELRASARQQAAWRRVIANAEELDGRSDPPAQVHAGEWRITQGDAAAASEQALAAVTEVRS